MASILLTAMTLTRVMAVSAYQGLSSDKNIVALMSAPQSGIDAPHSYAIADQAIA